MIIVSYDITNDKLRSQFSKLLKKYGRRLQFSVYEIKNSPRILNNLIIEVESHYKPRFCNLDSIVIFNYCESCSKKIKRYGYAVHEEKELVFFE